MGKWLYKLILKKNNGVLNKNKTVSSSYKGRKGRLCS